MPDHPLNRLILELRDYVNQPRIQHRLMRNSGLWLQLCSCMDAMGDTEVAILSYKEREYVATEGGRYLALYGLLQAMFLQQDAMKNLCEALQLPLKLASSYPTLIQIRNIRNDSIGHPTKRDRRGKSLPKTYSFISRIELRHETFALLTFEEGGSSAYQDVQVGTIIDEQTRFLQEILTSALQTLKRDDQSHKDRFKMTKLADIFDDSMGYEFEKVFEGVMYPDKSEYAVLNLDMLDKRLQRFKGRLEEREIEISAYEELNLTIQRLTYAFGKLRLFFADNNRSDIPFDDQGAYIFAWYAKEAMGYVKSMAGDIDNEYSEATS